MNSIIDEEKSFTLITKQNDTESVTTDAQINPVTTMMSVSAFQPVDDAGQNVIESIDAKLPADQPSEVQRSSTTNVDPSSHTSSDHQKATNPSIDNRSIAAWVHAATVESGSPTIERSPSLPSTLLEPIIQRSRGNSTVSTICDHQQSIVSDTMTTSQVSFSNDIQRRLSLPLNDQHQRTIEDDENRLLRPMHNEQKDDEKEQEDVSLKFLPVSESEESEIEKSRTKLPSAQADQVKFEARSPITRETSKKSSSVSFHASISTEAYRKSLVTHRRRRISWNANKSKPNSFNRSQSHVSNSQISSLHSQILRKQFKTAFSMPIGAGESIGDTTRQSSYISDSVFLSPSNTQSSSSHSYSHYSPDPRFTAIPSSTSYCSSNKSGIDSTNLETYSSDQIQSSSANNDDIDNEKMLTSRNQRDSRRSTTSNDTSRTQSLASSSDDELSNINSKMKGLKINKNRRKGPDDKRRDILKQLTWLLENKTTIKPRLFCEYDKHETSKSTQNSFVEPCSSLPSNNTLKSTLRNEPDIISNISNTNEPTNPLTMLRTSSPQLNIDPMADSYSSTKTTYSDSVAITSTTNTKPSLKNSSNMAASFSSSLHPYRNKRAHRRNLSGAAGLTREYKNVSNKSEQQSNSQPPEHEQELKLPLIRSTEAIINEHLIMINALLSSYKYNMNLHFLTQHVSVREFFYNRLNELSQRSPMHQRCSKVETKAFIDLINNFQMNRSYHYAYLAESVKDLIIINQDAIHLTNRYLESEDDVTKDGHIASNESSETSSPSFTRNTSTEPKCEVNSNGLSFKDHPLRFFRTLSQDYIKDCERTEAELKALFDLADQQHILYCLKHVDSGHTNDTLSAFHRRLDSLFVWYNLYYELTTSVRKISGLLRCDDCEDWPKLRFRSMTTSRERKAKQAKDSFVDCNSTTEESDDDDDDDEQVKSTEESEIEKESIDDDDDGENDILPRSRWPEEPLEHFSRLQISDDTNPNEIYSKTTTLNRIGCYRNFVYYMDKRSYQVKYDGLARTLIERVAPVLVKARLALVQVSDRRKVKIEQIVAGLPICDCQLSNTNKTESKLNTSNDENEDKLVDTDNPLDEDQSANLNIGELTIEKWLFHVLKSCPTIKTICSYTEDTLKHNWLEIHQQLGLPSLLPLYFFIINVLLDVMNECLVLYHKPYMNNAMVEIDSLCRQQLVREAKLVLRDALATRLFAIRMMEQFISHRKIIEELVNFDENTIKLYTHYKQFLSTVCVNRSFGGHDDDVLFMNNEVNSDLYYYVDEETSELIKEYYFSRDLTVTLGNRNEIHDLCVDFGTLIQRILVHLKEALNSKTEKFYQVFTNMSNPPKNYDGSHSADAIFDKSKVPSFMTSSSVPHDFYHNELSICDSTTSYADHKKNDIISSTREFRRNFDTIKQRAMRVGHLAKTLVIDFSLAAEFKCSNHQAAWQQLELNCYTQVKIHLSRSDSDDFDNFYVFVPPWLSTDKDQVEKLLSIICSQQISSDDAGTNKKETHPFYMIFLPKKSFNRQNYQWKGNLLFIQPSESTKLALNSIELSTLHLVVNRFDHWNDAVKLFLSHVGKTNIKFIRKLPRDEDIRLTFDQLPEHIERLSATLTNLVRVLNTLWDQDSTKLYLTEIVKFDELTIESKLVDLVLYIYNSGFDLFRLLCELLQTILTKDHEIFKRFVSVMNEFFCEWCKCVTKKFKHTSMQQTGPAKYKVFRPKWLSPGMSFLRLLAEATLLEVLSEDDYERLIKDIPTALDVLYGSAGRNSGLSMLKDDKFSDDHSFPKLNVVRSNSVSSTSTTMSRSRGHRKHDSIDCSHETLNPFASSPRQRILQKIQNLENSLEKKFRERKQIGHIFNNAMTTNGTIPDPVISLKMRNIDFPWRRGTRIGRGGASVTFRAINCSNGSIVCMKEMHLSPIYPTSSSAYQRNLRRIAEEIDMIMSINDPNIVRYFGIEKYKKTIYICMEYCLSTVNEFLNDIRSFQKRTHIKRKNHAQSTDSSDQDEDVSTGSIRLNSSLDINEHVRGFVKQLLQALMALHEHFIVHCDVKGDNIFIANENGHYIVKLGDFNLSHRLVIDSSAADGNDSHTTQKGTIYFKPPEPQYVYKSDIWALGCTIIEMLTGKLPWSNVTRPPEDKFYIQNQLLAKKGPPIPEEIKNQKEAYEFIELCLKPDPEERRTARELLSHPYPRVRTDS